jgi:hypothetical protein
VKIDANTSAKVRLSQLDVLQINFRFIKKDIISSTLRIIPQVAL